MLKATAQGPATRERILDAAVETLREKGYSQTSARAIARAGAFNQALIFYHFGSVNDLLLAALDRLGAARMEAYREALSDARSPVELAVAARRLYAEDVASGHSSVLAELFAASTGIPALRERMLARMRPWLEFTEGLIDRLLAGSPVAPLVDARAMAGAVLALYLGMDLLIHLDGDRDRASRLFEAGDRLAAVIGPFLEAIPE